MGSIPFHSLTPFISQRLDFLLHVVKKWTVSGLSGMHSGPFHVPWFCCLCVVSVLQVKEDEYRKIDPELLDFIEDVLLNRWVGHSVEGSRSDLLPFLPADCKRWKGAQMFC